MDVGKRFILWIGEPSQLVRVKAGPGAPKVLSVEPIPTEVAGGDDPAALGSWLANRVQAGEEVDILYQHHLLQLETFPSLGAGDLTGALRARLARDLLVAPEDLQSHTARIDGAGQTQAVFAAVLEATHLHVRRALESRGLREGRVGFACQLAVRALALGYPNGAWTVVTGLGESGSMLLAADPAGLVMARAIGAQSLGDAVKLGEQAKLFLPRLEPAQQPALLRPLGLPGVRLPGGVELPWPLDLIVPVFLSQKDWRIASRDDVDFPYYLSGPTWAFTGVMAALLLYTGYLGLQLWDIASVETQVRQLSERKTKLTADAKDKEAKLASLNYIQKHVRGVGAEVFDNARWLTWLGQKRDEVAGGLLFETLSIDSANIALTGSHGEADPILAFASEVAKALGEDAARLQSLAREDAGKLRFSIVIRRDTSVPPEDAQG